MTELVVVQPSNLMKYIDEINTAQIVALDTETNIADTMHQRWLLGFSCYNPATDTAMYFPINHKVFSDKSHTNIDPKEFQLVPNHIVFHNAKFDRHVFFNAGMNMDNVQFDDTLLISYIINENPPHGLKELADIYIDKSSSQDQDVIKRLQKGFSWENIPMEMMAGYATTDTVLTYKLYERLGAKLYSLGEKQLELYQKDLHFSLILQKMERIGIKIDPVEARLKAAQCGERMEEIKRILGYDPQKPSQLAKRLYSEPPNGLGLSPVGYGAASKSFPNGRPSMGVAALETHAHPEVGLVLEYRRVQKAKSTWYEGWVEVMDDDNRIHASYNQCATVTSRLSCSNPNLQQIPRDSDENVTKKMFPIKKLIRPTPGWSIYELDYSQIELRMASIYAEEEAMMNAFNSDIDVHKLVGDSLGVSRQVGKMVNFLFVFGGSAERLYDALHALQGQGGSGTVSLNECRQIHADYHLTYPGFRRLANDAMQAAFQKGYVQMWTMRRRHLRSSEAHTAINGIVQGSCSEVMRHSMLMIENERLDNARILSTVHDSIWLEVKNGSEHLVEIAQKLMEWPSTEFGLKFPVDVKLLAT